MQLSSNSMPRFFKTFAAGMLYALSLLSVNAHAQQDAITQLEHAHWVLDGSAKAPRTVYVFTDPNCPYCNKFWGDARPWVDSGKVQLRHIMVAVIAPTSAGKAATPLTDRDPAGRLS